MGEKLLTELALQDMKREAGGELLLAGFFCGPISLQFGGQLRFGCRTHCFFLGLRSAFDWRSWISAAKVRPFRLLSSRNLPFRSSAHGSLFSWRSSSFTRRTENTAQLFVQSLDLLFDRRSPLELINRKVEWIHGLVH